MKYVYESDSVSTCAGSSVATMNASLSVKLLVRLELLAREAEAFDLVEVARRGARRHARHGLRRKRRAREVARPEMRLVELARMHFHVADFGLERERHAARHRSQELDAHGAVRIRALDFRRRRHGRSTAEARDLAKRVVQRRQHEKAEREHRHAEAGDFPRKATVGRCGHGAQPPEARKNIHAM